MDYIAKKKINRILKLDNSINYNVSTTLDLDTDLEILDMLFKQVEVTTDNDTNSKALNSDNNKKANIFVRIWEWIKRIFYKITSFFRKDIKLYIKDIETDVRQQLDKLKVGNSIVAGYTNVGFGALTQAADKAGSYMLTDKIKDLEKIYNNEEATNGDHGMGNPDFKSMPDIIKHFVKVSSNFGNLIKSQTHTLKAIPGRVKVLTKTPEEASLIFNDVINKLKDTNAYILASGDVFGNVISEFNTNINNIVSGNSKKTVKEIVENMLFSMEVIGKNVKLPQEAIKLIQDSFNTDASKSSIQPKEVKLYIVGGEFKAELGVNGMYSYAIPIAVKPLIVDSNSNTSNTDTGNSSYTSTEKMQTVQGTGDGSIEKGVLNTYEMCYMLYEIFVIDGRVDRFNNLISNIILTNL